MKKKKKKKSKWIKFRHRVAHGIAKVILTPYVIWKFSVKIQRFRQQGDRQYLILLNHQTTFDQFFVGIAFKGPVYYIATEDIFSLGWLSTLLRVFFGPIPIKKQTTDARAVMNCMRVAKEGGTIALAPEGNRTYSGRTGYMNPAITSLVRSLKMPIAFFRIEGGYGVQPRWSDVTRKGRMRAYVSRVVEPEEYRDLSSEELLALIQKELYVDEGVTNGTFTHKKQAEYLERVIYVCPWCGLSEWESAGHTVTCKKCGRQVRYLATKELQGVGCDFPFRFVGEWYDYQNEFVRGLEPSDYVDTPLYRDQARLSEVIVYKNKNVLCKEASVSLYGDRVTISGQGVELEIPFCEAGVITVLGRNKLNIYHGDKIYQLKGDKRFNALKYVNFFYHYQNISKGERDGEFCGL